MNVASSNSLLICDFFLKSSISRHLLFGAPVRQAVALMIENIIQTRPLAVLTILVGLIDPRDRSGGVLIASHFHPDFGLRNPEIIALHDLSGIVATLNRFAHLREIPLQKTGITSGFRDRNNAAPFSLELITCLKLIPHPLCIGKIEKITLLRACVASSLRFCRKR